MVLSFFFVQKTFPCFILFHWVHVSDYQMSLLYVYSTQSSTIKNIVRTYLEEVKNSNRENSQYESLEILNGYKWDNRWAGLRRFMFVGT